MKKTTLFIFLFVSVSSISAQKMDSLSSRFGELQVLYKKGSVQWLNTYSFDSDKRKIIVEKKEAGSYNMAEWSSHKGKMRAFDRLDKKVDFKSRLLRKGLRTEEFENNSGRRAYNEYIFFEKDRFTEVRYVLGYDGIYRQDYTQNGQWAAHNIGGYNVVALMSSRGDELYLDDWIYPLADGSYYLDEGSSQPKHYGKNMTFFTPADSTIIPHGVFKSQQLMGDVRIVEEKDKYGLSTYLGRVIIPAKYENLVHVEYIGNFCARRKNKIYVFDALGNLLLEETIEALKEYPQWIIVYDSGREYFYHNNAYWRIPAGMLD